MGEMAKSEMVAVSLRQGENGRQDREKEWNLSRASVLRQPNG